MNEKEINDELQKIWDKGKTLKEMGIEHKEGDIVGVGGGFKSLPTKYFQLCNGEWLPILLKEKENKT